MHIRGVLARRLLSPEEFDEALRLYATLFGQPARRRFDLPDRGLTVAQVGQVLLIAGDAESLDPVRATNMTFLVNDLAAYADFLPTIGATIVHPVRSVPTGRNMLVRHPDGTVVEYVEHDRPDPADDTLSGQPA